jgi:hypothetical protein
LKQKTYCGSVCGTIHEIDDITYSIKGSEFISQRIYE